MIGTTIYKNEMDAEKYHECVVWCNETQQGVIEDKGDRYEVVANPYYEQPQTLALKRELESLEKYLEDTDYMVIKCMERGLDMKYEYPKDYVDRQNARNRINEIREILNV